MNKFDLNNTPWGPAEEIRELAPGITRIETAGHGGVFLDERRNERIPALLKYNTQGGLGLEGWYEEDEDMSIVQKYYRQYL